MIFVLTTLPDSLDQQGKFVVKPVPLANMLLRRRSVWNVQQENLQMKVATQSVLHAQQDVHRRQEDHDHFMIAKSVQQEKCLLSLERLFARSALPEENLQAQTQSSVRNVQKENFRTTWGPQLAMCAILDVLLLWMQQLAVSFVQLGKWLTGTNQSNAMIVPKDSIKTWWGLQLVLNAGLDVFLFGLQQVPVMCALLENHLKGMHQTTVKRAQKENIRMRQTVQHVFRAILELILLRPQQLSAWNAQLVKLPKKKGRQFATSVLFLRDQARMGLTAWRLWNTFFGFLWCSFFVPFLDSSLVYQFTSLMAQPPRMESLLHPTICTSSSLGSQSQ
jgi:hypothetical protein